MIDKIISALESMQEDMEEHGELQKARGVSSAIWLIEFMKDFADRKTEPIDKDINVRSKDEPQTCSVNGRPYDCGNCEYHKCTADEPQTDDAYAYDEDDWYDKMEREGE